MGVFREHYIGGVVSYSAFFGISMGTTFVGHWLFQKPIDWNSTVSIKPWWHIVACFVIAILFGLWPDVDIKSKSQSVFYRIFIVMNIFLILKGWYIESAFFGLFAMLPMIGKHRGWTHSRITMFFFSMIFVILPLYLHKEIINVEHWLSPTNLSLIRTSIPFYVAGLIGYATHLHLDGILLTVPKPFYRRGKRA